MGNRYIALIPAYEPGEKLINLARDLRGRGFDIVIVDDGSGMGYRDIFEEASRDAVVLTHPENRGKGVALRTGLSYILNYMAYDEVSRTPSGVREISGRDAVIVTVDADGQHLPEDVLRVARIAGSRRDALVLGSRELGKDIPARSRFGNTVTRHVYSAVTGVRVHDTQTGLRAFGRDLIPLLLEIKGDRYEYEINMLLTLAAEGYTIIEERIETVYEDNNSGSHFRTVRDSLRVYKEILKFSASSLASFATDYCVYAALLALTGAMGAAHSLVISNIGARLVSGTVNYTLNRKLVFRSRTGFAKTAAQYIALAALILAGNTVVLSILAGTFGINSMIAKLMTEMVFFIISWTVQKYVIFFSDGAEEASAAGEKDAAAAAAAGEEETA